MSNKVIIKRNELGQVIEVELVTPDVEPERKPVIEFLEVLRTVLNAEEENLEGEE